MSREDATTIFIKPSVSDFLTLKMTLVMPKLWPLIGGIVEEIEKMIGVCSSIKIFV